jgi:hypothetical protein
MDATPEKKSEILIEKARYFFETSIEDTLKTIVGEPNKISHLEKIRDYIFVIDTVIIVSDDETDAFTIFETINTRGKDLSSFDLLKNYIFKNFPTRTGVDEPKMIWTQIAKNVESERGTFFNRFWGSWIAKVTENKLYRRFSDHMRDTKKNTEFTDAAVLLKKLHESSIVYGLINSPNIDTWKIDKNFHIYYHLKTINGLFNLKVHYPFFLALFDEYFNKRINISLLSDTLLLMENFHFIFTHIVSPRASGLDSKYSKFAIRLRKEADKAQVIRDLRGELVKKIPSKSEYIEIFKKLNYVDDKDTIKFILLRLEKEVDPSLSLSFEMNSIEHLEPRSVASTGVNSIGNLFLLEEKYNGDKGDRKPFDLTEDKSTNIISYLELLTKYKSTKNIFSEIKKTGKWEIDDIEQRTTNLAERTYVLFSSL